MRFRLEHAASAMRSLAGAGERAVLVLLNGTFLKMMMPECCFLEFKFGEVMLMLMRMLPSVSFKSLSRVQACLLFESSAVSTVQALQTLWDDLLGSLNECPAAFFFSRVTCLVFLSCCFQSKLE